MSIIDKFSNLIFGGEDDFDEDEFVTEQKSDTEPETPRFSSRRAKVVDIHATAQLKVVVLQMESFEETKEVTDHLKSKKPVVINLEKLDRDVARRVVDFISGATYALDGNIQKVSNGIFLIAPINVGIMGDFKDELKNTGIFPWSY